MRMAPLQKRGNHPFGVGELLHRRVAAYSMTRYYRIRTL